MYCTSLLASLQYLNLTDALNTLTPAQPATYFLPPNGGECSDWVVALPLPLPCPGWLHRRWAVLASKHVQRVTFTPLYDVFGSLLLSSSATHQPLPPCPLLSLQPSSSCWRS